MTRTMVCSALVTLLSARAAGAGQAPDLAAAPDIPISDHDRVYSAEQFSNTVTVTDPASGEVLGVIRLGDRQPANLSPLYRGQLLVHGMGFSRARHMIVVVAIASNAVIFIDTATNAVQHVTYVGRSPHEAFFTPDGREVWVSVRGENYIAVLDAETYKETARIAVPNGPGMTIFSPDGKYGYVCSSFTPETDVITVAAHEVVGRVVQASPFSPNLAATPDGGQVWLTLKDVGKTQVFSARPPFEVLKTFDTGPITNHVNIVRNAHGQFAYVTVGGLNVVKVYRTDTFAQVATVPVGDLPHGIWPSGDGSRVYVGLENADQLVAIDTGTNRVVATTPTGQGPQALVYMPGAVPEGDGRQNLQPLDVAGGAVHLSLAPPGSSDRAPTSVALFDQGLTQIMEASVTGLEPKQAYVLALAKHPDGSGTLEPLASFTSNPAGSAIVNTVGTIRQQVLSDAAGERRYLVVAPSAASGMGKPVQIQRP